MNCKILYAAKKRSIIILTLEDTLTYMNYSNLILFFVFFTNNVFTQIDLLDSNKTLFAEIDSEEYLQRAMILNEQSNLQKRGNYTFKLDSSAGWRTGTNTFIPQLSYTSCYIYDTLNHRYISCSYDIMDGNPIPEDYTASSYDNQNRIIRQSFNSWNGSKENLDESSANQILTYSYNQDGLLDQVQEFDISGIASGIPLYKYEHRYTDIGKLEYYSRSYRSSDTFKIATEYHFEYDTSDLLISSTQFEFDTEQVREPVDSTNYIYLLDGTLMKRKYFLWLENRWNSWETFEHDYDNEGKLDNISSTLTFLATNGDSVIIEETRFFTYTQTGSLTGSSIYRENDSPVKLSSIGIANNIDVPDSDILFPRNLRSFWADRINYYENGKAPINYMITQLSEFDEQLNKEEVKIEYYYKELDPVSTQNKNLLSQDLIVFPNPSSEIIKFSHLHQERQYDISIYKPNGQLQFEKKISNNSEINISNFDPGTYFYLVEQNNDIRTGSFLKI